MMKTYNAWSLTMKKMQNYIPWSMLVVGAFAAQSGCVDAGETLRILRNQAPEADCEVPGGSGADFLSSGRIDVAANGGYLFTPLVENRALSNAQTERLVFVDGAVVKLDFADGFYSDSEINSFEEAGLSYFTQPFSGSIPAGGSSTFVFEIMSRLLLEDMATKLGVGESTRVIAKVEMRGTIDGGDVSSPTFNYPIEVCNGCLTNVVGACDALPDVQIREGGACQVLQDGVVDCCTASDGSLVCPAVAAAAE